MLNESLIFVIKSLLSFDLLFGVTESTY